MHEFHFLERAEIFRIDLEHTSGLFGVQKQQPSYCRKAIKTTPILADQTNRYVEGTYNEMEEYHGMFSNLTVLFVREYHDMFSNLTVLFVRLMRSDARSS